MRLTSCQWQIPVRLQDVSGDHRCRREMKSFLGLSGDKDSVKVSVTEKDGYCNLKYSFDEKGNLHVGGLLHDKDYTLTETRPADGYVTADAIVYQIRQKKAEDGSVSSVVSIKQEDGTYVDRQMIKQLWWMNRLISNF